MAGTPAYQFLAAELRREILTGVRRPGDRLTEEELGAATGLGRSTIREALRLLSSERMIRTCRGTGGGSFVAEPDSDTVAGVLAEGVGRLVDCGAMSLPEVFEVRRMIEVPAAGLAARHRTPAHLAQIAASMFHPDTDGLARKVAAHAQFHRAVAAASGNGLLCVVARPLYQVTPDQLRHPPSPAMWQRIDADHRAMLQAIGDRAPDRAMALAADHVDRLASGD
ncbi:FCD domain-containing protein [Dactylosporangium sp. NBC_01737]|uniref:FadR/GntR family transcriptional regulator n=1 Tax=Dactylosporangium sp. NBC_01737 TaxID=2975959 RepID=UPI002E106D37|nr:FCD domain-containing protein [Dactylosporangium sp. NBC_01737]